MNYLLQKAIINQLDVRNDAELLKILEQIQANGVHSGITGFDCASEVINFYYENHSDILDVLRESADHFGHLSVLRMFKTFDQLIDVEEDELAESLFNPDMISDSRVALLACDIVLNKLACDADFLNELREDITNNR